MTELLEVIDARIERSATVYDRTLDELVQAHEELERLAAIRELAASLDAPVEQDTTPGRTAALAAIAAPKQVPAPEVGPPEPDPTPVDPPAPTGDNTTRVLDTICKLGTCTKQEILAASGVPKSSVTKALRTLIDNGDITATGATVARRYAPTAGPPAAAPTPAPAVRKSTGAAKPLAALLRDVNATITNDPGLTEEQIAFALDIEREDVAVATGELLEREWIVLRPDGTYVPADDTAEEPLAA